MRSLVSGLVLSFFASAGMSASAQGAGYYKTPALSDDTLVFSSEGDLWRTGSTGGTALRLTTHEEVEAMPMISPDGQTIAFMAFYDGPGEVYTMPITGGKPVRMTHEGGGVSLRGWLDDNRLLYRTTNIPGTTPRLLRSIDRRSGQVSDIPFADADLATLADDGDTLFFTRYGLSIFADNSVQYRGGRMAQLWRASLSGSEEAVRLLADFGAPIRHPMYAGGRIVFVSDKSGVDNFWSISADGSDLRQHTSRTNAQIRSPYLNSGKVVFQSGADLLTFDISSNTVEPLSIFLMSDGDYKRERWLDAPLGYLEDARSSPKGDAVTVTARGQVATSFTGQRRRVDYEIPTDARARSAALNAEGDAVYAILDRGKQSEIWELPAKGYGDRKKLLSGSDAHIWDLFPSPHDATLIYTDKLGRLYHLDPETGSKTLIDTTESGNDYAFWGFNWSSGGRYLSYTFYDDRDMSRVAIYDTETKQKTVVTTGKFESFGATFSTDGKWLYFISNRNFNPTPGSPWGDRNMGPSFSERGKVFAVQLQDDSAFPFEPENELTKTDKEELKDKVDEEDDESEADEGEADIATAGLQRRLWEVPIGTGDFGNLVATERHLYVYSFGDTPTLKRTEFTHENPKLEDFATDVRGFDLSADGKTLFVQTGRGEQSKFLLLDATKGFPSDTSSQTVRFNDWKLAIDPKAEWRQMAEDAWRLHRDFAYDPDLRGVDWETVRSQYIPLAERIGHRSELDDLLAQMAAELGILHSQIRQGDQPEDGESGQSAFLGATYTPSGTGLRIDTIYTGEYDRPDTLGPLLQPGIDVRKGDVITAIDGKSVRSQSDLTKHLTYKAGQEVLIDYTRGSTALQEIVKPISRWQASYGRYAHWVQQNREFVSEKTNGEIGYIHMRAMGGNDVASFARDFYEHHDKDALIIDVRGNRGGNIDSWIIGTLLRKVWAFWKSPHGGPATTNMQQTFRGHLVILINEGTYSDGETFAAGVKSLDIAPLIGTQTAGAGIWLSARNILTDGGQARIAEYPQYGADGRWLIEGRGVSPDIEVSTPPRAAYNGEDAQLDRALAYLNDKLTTEPIPELRPKPLPPLGTTGEDVD